MKNHYRKWLAAWQPNDDFNGDRNVELMEVVRMIEPQVEISGFSTNSVQNSFVVFEHK